MVALSRVHILSPNSVKFGETWDLSSGQWSKGSGSRPKEGQTGWEAPFSTQESDLTEKGVATAHWMAKKFIVNAS